MIFHYLRNVPHFQGIVCKYKQLGVCHIPERARAEGEDKMEKPKSAAFIQQHLANERTYLAWTRTAIAIIGIGFLISNLHFNFLPKHSAHADLLANVIGFASIISGLFIIGLSTRSYFLKAKAIDSEVFKPEKNSILVLTGVVVTLILLFGFYISVVFP